MWLGISLGLVAGATVSVLWKIHDNFTWRGTALLAAAGGTVGGMLAGMGLAIYKRANRGR